MPMIPARVSFESPLTVGIASKNLGGLGEYPGYYCYDSDRPSWLPYFLDDFTESACKWNPATIAGNIYHCVTGEPDCGEPSEAAKDPTKSGPGVVKPGQQPNIPKCGTAQVYNPDTNQCEFNPTSPVVLIAGAAAVGITLLLLTRR